MDELIRKLEKRRAALLKTAGELLAKSGELLAANGDAEERSRLDGEHKQAVKDIKDIDAQLEKLKAQAKREQRGAAAYSGNEHTEDGGTSEPRAVVTYQPPVYGPGNPRSSYFLDMARDQLNRGDGDEGVGASRDRLQRHAQEIDKRMPERRAAVERRAAKAYEDAFANSAEDRQALTRMESLGISPFERERRFVSRTDGQGGYFVPPLWLVDQYIPYLRADRVFANQWSNFPLPAGTDSINIPRLVLGTATGPQTADGGPVPGRDATDSFVNALVRTVAGQQDAAIQLLDQSPIAFDQVIFKDLMADYGMQLSGQLILGSNANGQLNGLYPAGTLGTSSGPSTTGFIINNAATVFTAATPATANLYAGVAQLISQIARNRFRPPTRVFSNPAVFYALASAADSTGRPLIIPQGQGPAFNQVAGEPGGPIAQGPMGWVLGVPWFLDPNIPLTFGGTGATQPSIGVISNGNTAPVPGSGGAAGNAAIFTPMIAAVADDLYLWEGSLRSRVLSEVLSGTLQVRFQVYAYVASMPNRYQNSSSQLLSYGNYNTVGTTNTVLCTTGTGGLVNF